VWERGEKERKIVFATVRVSKILVPRVSGGLDGLILSGITFLGLCHYLSHCIFSCPSRVYASTSQIKIMTLLLSLLLVPDSLLIVQVTLEHVHHS
jgi:hypothetical protein